MESGAFLQDFAIVMFVAGAVAVVFRWLGQPAVLGYILAGVIIGPHVLPRPLIHSEESINTLAELGIVFLLFALGLEFNFRKIRQLGVTAFIVAPLETGLMFFAGYQLGRAFGWSATDAVYLGGIMMISSTTIITKTLTELGLTRHKFAEVIFGILIAEDIIAVLLVASLSAVAQSGGLEWSSLLQVLGGIAVFLVAAVIMGLLLVPRLLGLVGRFKRDETLLITVLGLLFALSLLAVKLGYSAGLGAFIMGALIAESHEYRRVERIMAPLRDMFAAVFFVAIGLLIQPQLLVQFAGPVLIISATLIAGKVLACSFGSFAAGYDRGTALRVGFGLAQIGEFSFITASLGAKLGVTSAFLYPITVTVSAITSVLTPFLIRAADHVIALHDRLAPASLLNYQHDYHQWVQRVWHARAPNLRRRIVRTTVLQLGINVALIAGFFGLAVLLHRIQPEWLRHFSLWERHGGTLLWLAALALSLPVFIAFVRKLQALSMMLADLSIRQHESERQKQAIRTMLSNTILFTGSIGMAVLLLLLSSPLLPSWEILVLLAILAVGLAVLLRAWFVRLYARAQTSIRETLQREHEAPHPETARPLPALLEDAELQTVELVAGSPGAGHTIRDLALRSRTGATVVTVRHNGNNTVNPGPDTILEPGDQLLLVGTAEQLQAADELLRGAAS